jgi:hypothetical protein
MMHVPKISSKPTAIPDVTVDGRQGAHPVLAY